MQIAKNKIATITIALILMFAASTFMTAIPQAAASVPPATTQTTGPFPAATPSSWINLITTTPNGEYRPESGVTNYPWLLSKLYDQEGTSYTPSDAPNSTHILWRVDRSAEMCAIDKGRVFMAEGNTLECRDAYTGDIIWEAQNPTGWAFGAEFVSVSPLNGIVYVGSGAGDTSVYAFSENTGALLWSSPQIWNSTVPAGQDLTVLPATGMTRVLVVNGSMIYATVQTDVGVGPSYVICYEERGAYGCVNTIASGDQYWVELWNFSVSMGEHALCVDNGKVYFGDFGADNIYCLNATTGTLIWKFTPGVANETFWQTINVVDGRVYEPSGNTNTLYCLNATTGDLLWTYVATPSAYLDEISSAYGIVYLAGGEEGNLYALNATTGTLLWTFKAEGSMDWLQPTIAAGNIYFPSWASTVTGYPAPGTYPGVLFCVNAFTGNLVWKMAFPYEPKKLTIADGYGYVTAELHYVYCIGAGPTTTTLAASTNYMTAGSGAVVLSGSVTDESPFSQQNPTLQSPCVSGVPVILSYIASDGTWTDFGNTTTNSAGQFTYSFTPPSTGAYTFVARFEGNNAYCWSSAETSAVQVNPATPTPTSTPMPVSEQYFVPAIAGLFVLIIITLALVILLFLRKRSVYAVEPRQIK